MVIEKSTIVEGGVIKVSEHALIGVSEDVVYSSVVWWTAVDRSLPRLKTS